MKKQNKQTQKLKDQVQDLEKTLDTVNKVSSKTTKRKTIHLPKK